MTTNIHHLRRHPDEQIEDAIAEEWARNRRPKRPEPFLVRLGHGLTALVVLPIGGAYLGWKILQMEVRGDDR